MLRVLAVGADVKVPAVKAAKHAISRADALVAHVAEAGRKVSDGVVLTTTQGMMQDAADSLREAHTWK